MATISLTFKDSIYAAALASFDGATDPERLAAFKQWLKGSVRERVAGVRERAAREAANATMLAALDQIAIDLADTPRGSD